ncbi:hypothetical protein BAE44_0007487 [Dichanthelium oligosanthes]|uniref:Uncharacterized protein n=1 Tax=Dichanthelium oligosanthes TaxID=888268 RepID=A0A1E5W282_9POAL|nr:hypothetical protein BAE44_0007487 [Dichanthelium oligosanthes]
MSEGGLVAGSQRERGGHERGGVAMRRGDGGAGERCRGGRVGGGEGSHGALLLDEVHGNEEVGLGPAHVVQGFRGAKLAEVGCEEGDEAFEGSLGVRLFLRRRR